jgi:hypothetical protein
MVSRMSDSDTLNVPDIEERMFWMPITGACRDFCTCERRTSRIKHVSYLARDIVHGTKDGDLFEGDVF